MRLFTAFTFDDIVYFEKLMILKIGHKMSSLVSPSYFLSYFIGLCHGIMVDQEKLMNIAQNIICSFSESEYLISLSIIFLLLLIFFINFLFIYFRSSISFIFSFNNCFNFNHFSNFYDESSV